MKFQLKTLCFIFFLFLISSTPSMAENINITDMAGRNVIAPADPDRIICVGPGVLRLIVYLQASDKVVGVEEIEKRRPEGRPYRLAHPELGNLPRIGQGGAASVNKKPDLEAVLAVQPEVIFVSYMDAVMADELQHQLGIPVVILSYGKLAAFDEAVYDSLKLAGKILNREQRAEAVVQYIEKIKADLIQRTKGASEDKRPSVYIGGLGYRGAHGIESTELRYIPFEWTGVKNAAEGRTPSMDSHLFMDKETLLGINPDIIFIDAGGYRLIQQDMQKKPAYYRSLKAFQTGKVYRLLPCNYYTANIETALADAYAVSKVIYPEKFSDVSFSEKADEIYTILAGKPVYKEMKEVFGGIGEKLSLQ